MAQALTHRSFSRLHTVGSSRTHSSATELDDGVSYTRQYVYVPVPPGLLQWRVGIKRLLVEHVLPHMQSQPAVQSPYELHRAK